MRPTRPHFKLSAALYPDRPGDQALIAYLEERTTAGESLSSLIRQGLAAIAQQAKGERR